MDQVVQLIAQGAQLIAQAAEPVAEVAQQASQAVAGNEDKAVHILAMIGAGVVMGFAAVGSGFGIGIAGSAVIGAWKRCYKANKPAPMVLLTFAGAPLTQVFYGFILMQQMLNAATLGTHEGHLLGMGIGSGLAICFSAIAQGSAGAAAADALSDTGKGFANYIAVVGICETVALFAMVLSMTTL